MKPALSSKYEDIAQEARDTVQEAALRAGLSVGEWLRLAGDSAGLDLAAGRNAGASGGDAALTAIQYRLDDLASLLGSRRPNTDAARTNGLRALETRLSDLAQNLSRLGDEAPRRIADSITRLNERLDQLIAEGRAASDDFESRLAAVDGALSALQADSSRFSTTTWSLEAALTEIEDRQRLIDAEADLPANAPSSSISLAGLENELRQLTKQMRGLRQATSEEDGIAELRRELATIKRTLADAMPRRALQALESEIHLLTNRVNDGRNRGVNSAGLANVERNLGKICDALGALAPAESLAGIERNIGELTRKIDRIASTGANPAMMKPLETAIAELRNLSTRVASGQALANLAAEVRGLAERIDRFVSPKANPAPAEPDEEDIEPRERSRDFGALRENYIENNRLARASLEGVHQMMDRLVGRLGTSEKTRAAMETTTTSGEPQRSSGAGKGEEPAKSAPEILASDRIPGPAVDPASNRTIAVSAPPLAPHDPIEPGSGGPGGLSPAERIAASEALHPNKPAVNKDAESRANFIAAARRAARAAAEGDADPRGSYSGTAAAGGKTKKGKRKNIVLGATAILLFAGASVLALNFVGFGEGVSVQSPKVVAKGRAPMGPGDSRAAQALPTATPPSAPVAGAADAATVAPGAVSRQMSLLDATDPVAFAAPSSGLLGAGAVRDVNAFAGANAPLTPPESVPSEVTGSAAKPQTMAAVDPQASFTAPAAALAGRDGALPESIGSPRLRAAAAAGDPAAAYEVALRYAEARGVPRNLDEAARWFERAASQGLAPAQYRLGSLYEKGRGVKRDLVAARRYYQAAATLGNAKAMHNLAVLYAEGSEGKPDYKTAAEWFRKAALHGIADSQYNLGILYARGIGVAQSLAESYKWFMLAAQQGDQDAGRKRDEVATRLEPQALVAAKLAAQTFNVEPQPPEALAVKVPAGGWEETASAPAGTKPGKGVASRKKNAS